MPKTSIVQRELKRQKLTNKFRKKRAELKEQIRQGFVADDGSAYEALEQLQKLPRNSSKSRLQGGCSCCGRSRAVYRKFGLCRLCLRKFSMQGFVPGVGKSSW